MADPGNLESKAMLGNFLVQAGRLDEALRVYEGLRSRGAGRSATACSALPTKHKRRGDYPPRQRSEAEGPRAGREMKTRPERSHGATTEAAYAEAEVAVARGELKQSTGAVQDSIRAAVRLARLNAHASPREQALPDLERSLNDDDYIGSFVGLSLLKVDQAWDLVRGDPRFAAVVRRIGIP